jgi:hypothetical protein
MPRQLTVDVLQDPSNGYTVIPPRRGDPFWSESGKEPLGLVVMLRCDPVYRRLHLSAFRGGERTPKHGVYQAYLPVTADELLQAASHLRTEWRDRFVRHQMTDEDGVHSGAYPFCDSVDLGEHGVLAKELTDNLLDEGQWMLEQLLEGSEPGLPELREFLLDTLTGGEGLRVSFDSDLPLPWPMMAVEAPPGQERATGFLGYRHQIEQTGSSYSAVQGEFLPRTLPVTSLNTDSSLDSVGRAPEVRKLLEERSRLTVRTESRMLLGDLAEAVLDDDVMYFWCHGDFIPNGSEHPHLAVRLSDSRPIDASLVRRKRRHHLGSTDALFRPFVLLNACHAGQIAVGPGLKHLGSALVDLGAEGVLGPQIEIPQLFASEYAYTFLEGYLSGVSTAGEMAMKLARQYLKHCGNPLALAYSLHCGIDSRLETAP